MRITFLGDISLNDNYVDLYMKGIDPFTTVEPVLRSSNFVVGNLECMAKGEDGENFLKQPRLTTTVDTLNYLTKIHLNLAFLAQNHVYDHLKDGFKKTTDFLADNSIKYLGAGYTSRDAAEPIIITKDGISVTFLNYVTSDTNPNLPSDAGIYLNIFNVDKCVQDIKQLKLKTNHIILSLHWGGRVEGGLFPDWDQPKIARELIDAGADLIIGHHSHTIQPYEVYKGKYIFYSLGNFCFSDYWFNDELNVMPKRRMICAIIEINFSLSDYVVKIDYYLNEKDRFSGYKKYKYTLYLQNQIFKILSNYKFAWYIYYFHKQMILPLVLFFRRKDITFSVKIIRLYKYVNKKLTKSN